MPNLYAEKIGKNLRDKKKICHHHKRTNKNFKNSEKFLVFKCDYRNINFKNIINVISQLPARSNRMQKYFSRSRVQLTKSKRTQ